MGGFMYEVVAPPEEIMRIDAALSDLAIWLEKNGYITEYNYEGRCLTRDTTGLTEYSILKSLNDSLCTDESGKPFWIAKDFVTEITKPKMEAGCWMLFWMEISWFWRTGKKALLTLEKLCIKHKCENFFLELINSGTDMDRTCFEEFSKALAPAGFKLKRAAQAEDWEE